MLMQFQITNIRLVTTGVVYIICETSQWNTSKIAMKKQSNGLIGNLKPEHKNSTNRSTMSLTTDIDSQAPIIWNRQEGAVI